MLEWPGPLCSLLLGQKKTAFTMRPVSCIEWLLTCCLNLSQVNYVKCFDLDILWDFFVSALRALGEQRAELNDPCWPKLGEFHWSHKRNQNIEHFVPVRCALLRIWSCPTSCHWLFYGRASHVGTCKPFWFPLGLCGANGGTVCMGGWRMGWWGMGSPCKEVEVASSEIPQVDILCQMKRSEIPIPRYEI